MGAFVAALGLINSTLFGQDVSQTLPYIAVGVIVWGFLSACITEGSTTFISRESFIRNVPLPISLHIYQMLARNGIIMGFIMVIYLGVLIWSRTLPGQAFFLIVFSAPLLLINVAWMSLAAAVLSTRYRDIPQVIASVLQVVFFLTPIFWSTAAMPTRPHFVQFNPLFHLLEIVREPLLGNAPHLTSWGISVLFATAGFYLSALSPGLYPHRLMGLTWRTSPSRTSGSSSPFSARVRARSRTRSCGRVMSGARDIVNVRAIDDLSFEVADGDGIGLVGHNGSGKTTPRRVLAGIYRPNSGMVRIEGSVGTLLDPTAGMDPEATGLENIFLRGYFLGLSKSQIEAQLDDIAGFTELGDFLSLPMKTYSAGMSALLAFAISTAMHHDILLIDEGIGAGDASFQEKAFARIEGLFDPTPIVILANHSESLIDRFGNRWVTMERGRMVAEADPSPARTEAP